MPEFRCFAKIFQAPDCCQILVQRTYDDEEEQPLVQFSVYPINAGLGVCSTSLGFATDEDADEMFDGITPEDARTMIQPLLEALNRLQLPSGGDYDHD